MNFRLVFGLFCYESDSLTVNIQIEHRFQIFKMLGVKFNDLFL